MDEIDRRHPPASTPTGATATTTGPALTATVSTTDDLGPLPSGWQMSKTESGRLFFIDHINKRTTWVGETNLFIRVQMNIKTNSFHNCSGRSTHW